MVGTRPGIIKFSPVVRSLGTRGLPFFVIHTGQHYSENMDKVFFEELQLPKPKYHNKMAPASLHGYQTAQMLTTIELELWVEKPKVVIVGGDANTNLAGALAARKMGLTLVHMEAGLRSGDWRMPEEHNRVMIDHISDVCLAPTVQAQQNLVADNVRGRIEVVGNTIVDAVYQNIELVSGDSILRALEVFSKEYALVTIHREENVDNWSTFSYLVSNLVKMARHWDKEMVFPIHPRTKKQMNKYGIFQYLVKEENIKVIEPVGYLSFLNLLKNAAYVLTDSGGVQEEACILGVPCITLRDNTERPETVEVGANYIAGHDYDDLIRGVKHFDTHKEWRNPFGDGLAGERICDILTKILWE